MNGKKMQTFSETEVEKIKSKQIDYTKHFADASTIDPNATFSKPAQFDEDHERVLRIVKELGFA